MSPLELPGTAAGPWNMTTEPDRPKDGQRVLVQFHNGEVSCSYYNEGKPKPWQTSSVQTWPDAAIKCWAFINKA